MHSKYADPLFMSPADFQLAYDVRKAADGNREEIKVESFQFLYEHRTKSARLIELKNLPEIWTGRTPLDVVGMTLTRRRVRARVHARGRGRPRVGSDGV